MIVLKSFEVKAINLLTANVFPAWQADKMHSSDNLIRLDFTERGYFITLSSSSFPIERLLLNSPPVNGKVDELLTGFVAFVENNELTLECFAYDGDIVPDNFRDLNVIIFI
ncbi:hypothetical protein ROLI_004640 [Roseobacter fucihabitans]|uniref:Uncharacterized protein n=1 Tax=Roseobacter fucihabitans TaxID=1537242 RepID=A0ABZ2BQ80_9RHOB|nr:hypothetical protein [Roseobacter litoralis]MBC6964638.1 hypothetical protein [Roseobacter litoralis]